MRLAVILLLLIPSAALAEVTASVSFRTNRFGNSRMTQAQCRAAVAEAANRFDIFANANQHFHVTFVWQNAYPYHNYWGLYWGGGRITIATSRWFTQDRLRSGVQHEMGHRWTRVHLPKGNIMSHNSHPHWTEADWNLLRAGGLRLKPGVRPPWVPAPPPPPVYDWTNPRDPTDVDDSGRTTSRDALLVINRIGDTVDTSRKAIDSSGNQIYPDPNGDGQITGADALKIINSL